MRYLIILACLFLTSCSHNSKIIATDGVVKSSITKPVEFEGENTVILFSNGEKIITFTDIRTGNRTTIVGDFTINGIGSK